MASGKIIQSATSQFRKRFILPENRVSGSNVNRWFPNHMYISMKVMQARLRSVDCIVEVHDARIPFSGRNEEFHKLLYSIRPHILVLNKSDLIDEKLRPRIEFKLRERNRNLQHILWTNCKLRQRESIEQVMKAVNSSVENMMRFNRAIATEYSLMVIGIPNVGKSSLVNAIRNMCGLSSAARVGARPGVTRSVQEKVRIQASPLIYMVDTPGVVAPNITDVDVGMKMAVCETILQHLVGVDLIADYLLYHMNRCKDFKYLDLTDLKEPTDDIRKLLFEIALKTGCIHNRKTIGGVGEEKVFDLDGAANKFLTHFRTGKFGCQFMDMEVLKSK